MGSAWLMLYHDVQVAPDTLWAVSPAQLAQAVNGALRHNLVVTNLEAALAGSGDCVSLTFDDAYRSVYETAFPLLSSLGVKATVFVPIDCVGRTNTYDAVAGIGPGRECPIMTWRELADLAAHGWAIESHGCAHLPLSQLTAAQVEEEVRRSKHTIEDRLGRSVAAFAYPYGIVPAWENGTTLDTVLESTGYRFGVLACGGAARTPPPNPYRITREPIAAGQQVAFAAGA